jgi:uncharacterized membrane-anchored protein
MWMGEPAPCTVLRPAAVRRRDMASYQALSCLIVAVGGGAFLGGCEAPALGYLVEC